LSETETDDLVNLLTQLKLRKQQNDAIRSGISLSYSLYQNQRSINVALYLP